MKPSQGRGFTIVELLIVIVVIAILAAITIVAYNGIRNRAMASRIASEFSQAAKSLEAAKTTEPDNMSYPVNAPSGLSSGTFTYSQLSGGKGFCLVKQYDGVNYFITSASTAPTVGNCTGMLGWWKLNGTYTDSSGNGRDMVLNGSDPALVNGQNGQAGGAYSFNRTQFLSYSNATAGLDLNTPMTISGWSYNESSPTGYRGIFGFRFNTSSFYVLQLTNGTRLECRRQAAASSADGGAVYVTPAAWNFIAFVYNGTGVQCYVNGVAGATASQTGPLASTNQQFNIASDGGGSNNFIGAIDDVRWYARALSTSELQEMYQQNAQ